MHRAAASILAAAGILAGVAAGAAEDDLEQLLRGVKRVNASGLPGPVAALDSNAFAVVMGRLGNARLPLVAAARYGKGRAVAFGKGEFFTPDAFTRGETGQLLVNAVRWAAAADAPRVGVLDCGGVAAELRRCGLRADDIGLDGVAGVDVVLVRPARLDERGVRTLREAVRDGKGLLAGCLGWGWLQLNPGKTLADDHQGNRLMRAMGLVWTGGILERTDGEFYATDVRPSRLANASDALRAARAAAAGERELTASEARQVGAVLTAATEALPDNDTDLLPAVRAFLDSQTAPVAPTPKHPVRDSDALQRLLLTMQTRDALSAAPRQTRAHPAAAAFPGTVPASAQTVAREVRVDTATPGWHSTGLYAPPGRLVTVTVPPELTRVKARIRIGSTSCRLWQKSQWSRAPEVTREFAVTEPTLEVANAFGGLLYVVLPPGLPAGAAAVTFAGAVPAPLYVRDETTMEDWRGTIRHRPAPRAEIAGRKVILTVPSEVVRTLDDPERLMQTWDRVVTLCEELAQWPDDRRQRPERYVADVQLCAGYMHAGYPIMVPVSTADDLVDADALLAKGNWGFFHEMGHNHQDRMWTFGGTGEVTVNLFTLYVMEHLCGLPPRKTRLGSGRHQRRVISYFDNGPNFRKWRSSPFLALEMYVQLQEAFGWETFRNVFREYRDLPKSERPAADDDRRDQWMTRFSRACGRNLAPFFKAWAVPVSTRAVEAVRGLPEWLPEQFPPVNLKEDRVARKARVVRVSSENSEGQGGNAVDGFEDTIWHSRWRGGNVPKHPHEIVVDLGERMTIRGVTLLPRQHGVNGWIRTFELYTGGDGDSWSEAASGNLTRTKELKTILFDRPRTCRLVRLVATAAFDDQPWASLAEIDVVAGQ